MKYPERIEAKRLVLRVPRMDDAPAIFAGRSQDTEVTRYLTWRPHQRVQATEDFIQASFSIASMRRRMGKCRFTVCP